MNDTSLSSPRQAPSRKRLRLTTMMSAQPTSRGLIDYLLLALVFVNFACLGYYLFFGYQFDFHADSAAANLLAQEIYETGQYFPRDWNYVYGDLWVVFVHSWILVLVPFFPNGFMLHAVAGLVGAMLTGLFAWLAGGVLGMSTRTRLLVLALFSASFTPSMSEHLFGQQAYGTIFYMSCAVLFCGWKFICGQERMRWPWGLCCAALVMLVVWANPQRALVYYVVPLMAGLAALYGVTRVDQASPALPRRHFASLVGIVALATALGAAAYRAMLAGTLYLGSTMPINWLEFPAMISHVLRGFHGLVGVIGGVPPPNTPINTPIGAYHALHLVAGIVIVLVTPYALGRYLRSGDRGHVFFAASALASIGLSLFVYLASTLAAGGPPETSVRYLIPGVMLALLVFVAFVAQCETGGAAKRLAGAAAIGVLALSAPVTLGVTHLPRHLEAGGIDAANPRMRLAAFLESKGLHYGYATFWHAGQNTVLSRGAVKVRQIDLTNGLPIPRRHLSSNRWYEPQAWKGKTFLMLTKDELPAINLPDLYNLTGRPIEQIAYEDFSIFVFDHNIAANIPGWQITVKEPLQYPAMASTHHVIGRYVPENRSLTAEKGEAGALRFGPYQPVVGGRYLATFDIDVEAGDAANFGFVDVVAKGGSRTLATRTVERTGRQRIVLAMAFDDFVSDLEFRVFSTGAGKMSLFNVELANDNRH